MSFDIARLRRSDRIIGVGAVLFFIFLFFFKWYGFSSNAQSIGGVNVGGDFSFNGWHTFTNSRWIWLGLIAAVSITYGGYLGMQAEGTSLADVREQASGAFSGLASAVGSDGPGSSSAAPSSAATPQAAPPIPPPIPPVGGAPAAEPPEAGGV
jgi:hypothetical protein